ncbi:MAG: hypothetical protein JOZ96_25245 [Acidobacteria bacterium]|nr:hypothetical protein [Acidobacteriota bacterium]
MGAAGAKPEARGRRSGPKSSARALALLAGCLLLAACQPEGGDLVPLPPGEGAALAATEFEGDTLVVTREGVTLRARGRWSVADAATSVILDVSNANAEPAAIDFGRGELSLEGEGGGRLTLRSAARESGAGAFLPEKRAEVGGGASDKFVLEYWMPAGGGSFGVARDMKGHTVTLRLPVEVRKGAAADSVFGFRCEERRPRR